MTVLVDDVKTLYGVERLACSISTVYSYASFLSVKYKPIQF